MSEPAGARLHQLPWQRGALLGLAAGLVLAVVAWLGALDAFDLKLFDWRYRLRGVERAPDQIALVEVDDATLRGYRQWPLPRSAYALLIDALERAGARAIALDLVFIRHSAVAPEGDMALATVTHENGNLVNAIGFLPSTASYSSDVDGSSATRPELIRHGRPISRQTVVTAADASLPYDELLAASDALGHTELAVDRDGAVRSLPMFVRYGDWAYPALSLRVLESAARTDPSLPQYELAADGLYLHRAGARRRVPTDRFGNTRFVFAGDERAFAHRISMLDVLQSDHAGDTLAIARAVRGRIVLIGVTASGELATDVGATPFDESTPLVYAQANAIAAAVQGRFLTSLPRWALALTLVLLGALLGAVYSRLHLGLSTAVAFAAGVLVAGGDMALFAWRDLDVPATALLLLPPLAWAGVEGLRRRVNERTALARAKELDVARSIQRKLLPEAPPDFAGLQVYGLNVPTDEVGGDYFDWPQIAPGRLAVAVGDVTGHGVPAALLMTHLRASLHSELERDPSAAAVVTAMNRSLSRDTAEGRGATFFLALFEAGASEFRYCSAGHNPAYLVHAGAIRELGATGIPIGVLDSFAWSESHAVLAPGDVLVVYSDGVIDCEFKRTEYGEDRWRTAVLAQAARGVPARDMAEALMAGLREYSHGTIAPDDVTIVVVRAVPTR